MEVGTLIKRMHRLQWIKYLHFRISFRQGSSTVFNQKIYSLFPTQATHVCTIKLDFPLRFNINCENIPYANLLMETVSFNSGINVFFIAQVIAFSSDDGCSSS